MRLASGGSSARLVGEAQTNGGLFLAFPANQAQRNSINDVGSLLRVLCGTSEATHCRGPTAAQAEFRTEDGTWSRAEGLLLIVAGAVGLILLLGFIALHLLKAALMSLFYLLLAPAAVLAPALGDGGRAAFRGWAARLLGAVCSKLFYSFILGAVLLMTRVLLSLELGWWVQWLLVSVLWWSVFQHRRQLLGLVEGGGGRESRVRGLRLTSTLASAREAGRLSGWVRGRVAGQAPNVARKRLAELATRQRAGAMAGRRPRAPSSTTQGRQCAHGSRCGDTDAALPRAAATGTVAGGAG